MPVKPIVLNEREKQKNGQKPLSDNVNAFCGLTSFMVGKKLEVKVTSSLNRVKDFLLENHGFKFSRADPILCETVLGKNPPGKNPAPQTLNLTLSLT